jgi:hypothetical protein
MPSDLRRSCSVKNFVCLLSFKRFSPYGESSKYFNNCTIYILISVYVFLWDRFLEYIKFTTNQCIAMCLNFNINIPHHFSRCYNAIKCGAGILAAVASSVDTQTYRNMQCVQPWRKPGKERAAGTIFVADRWCNCR